MNNFLYSHSLGNTNQFTWRLILNFVVTWYGKCFFFLLRLLNGEFATLSLRWQGSVTGTEYFKKKKHYALVSMQTIRTSTDMVHRVVR